MTDDILACKRLDELSPTQAARTGSVVRRCAVCDCEVWVVPRNLLLRARVACRECAAGLMAAELAAGGVGVILPAAPVVDLMTGHENN